MGCKQSNNFKDTKAPASAGSTSQQKEGSAKLHRDHAGPEVGKLQPAKQTADGHESGVDRERSVITASVKHEEKPTTAVAQHAESTTAAAKDQKPTGDAVEHSGPTLDAATNPEPTMDAAKNPEPTTVAAPTIKHAEATSMDAPGHPVEATSDVNTDDSEENIPSLATIARASSFEEMMKFWTMRQNHDRKHKDAADATLVQSAGCVETSQKGVDAGDQTSNVVAAPVTVGDSVPVVVVAPDVVAVADPDPVAVADSDPIVVADADPIVVAPPAAMVAEAVPGAVVAPGATDVACTATVVAADTDPAPVAFVAKAETLAAAALEVAEPAPHTVAAFSSLDQEIVVSAPQQDEDSPRRERSKNSHSPPRHGDAEAKKNQKLSKKQKEILKKKQESSGRRGPVTSKWDKGSKAQMQTDVYLQMQQTFERLLTNKETINAHLDTR